VKLEGIADSPAVHSHRHPIVHREAFPVSLPLKEATILIEPGTSGCAAPAAYGQVPTPLAETLGAPPATAACGSRRDVGDRSQSPFMANELTTSFVALRKVPHAASCNPALSAYALRYRKGDQ
jgi:hypothetical protein